MLGCFSFSSRPQFCCCRPHPALLEHGAASTRSPNDSSAAAPQAHASLPTSMLAEGVPSAASPAPSPATSPRPEVIDKLRASAAQLVGGGNPAVADMPNVGSPPRNSASAAAASGVLESPLAGSMIAFATGDRTLRTPADRQAWPACHIRLHNTCILASTVQLHWLLCSWAVAKGLCTQHTATRATGRVPPSPVRTPALPGGLRMLRLREAGSSQGSLSGSGELHAGPSPRGSAAVCTQLQAPLVDGGQPNQENVIQTECCCLGSLPTCCT